LYQGVVSDPSGIAFVCENNHQILGFVAGTGESRNFYGRLLARRWHRFALASVVPVLRKPGIAPKLLDAFRKTTEEPDEEACGLLMSLAVEPAAQSGGIGTALVHGFLAKCKELGLSSVHLTTDHFGNDRTNRFYLKLGFTVSRITTTPQGRVLNDYRIEIG
jgi:GNAT superfamily N-acetyltransferase